MSHNPVPGANILIVDDTPDNLRLLSAMLSAQGYEVRKAIDGLMAIASVQKEPPDLVLLDIMMPGMNGYEVCRKLKASEPTQDIPVIFLSALDESSHKVSAFDVGGVDYITKPFEIQEVLVRVHTQLTLRQQQKQLQRQNAKLQQEIHDRLTAEAALQSCNIELESRVQARTAELLKLQAKLRQALAREQELNLLKDEFLNNISHELRTPLNGIIGFLHLVLDGFCEEREEELEMLHQADEAAMHLLSVIENMLDIINLKHGDIPMDLRWIELGDPLKAAISARMPHIEEKGLHLQPPDANKMPQICTDPEKLEQVFLQVLDNAVKFTDCGSITITTQVESGFKFGDNSEASWVRVTVLDTGIGIDPSVQPKLFQPFVMGDSSSTRRHSGNGLGLALARNLLELIGGCITLSSEGKDRGTTVTIALPLNPQG